MISSGDLQPGGVEANNCFRPPAPPLCVVGLSCWLRSTDCLPQLIRLDGDERCTTLVLLSYSSRYHNLCVPSNLIVSHHHGSSLLVFRHTTTSTSSGTFIEPAIPDASSYHHLLVYDDDDFPPVPNPCNVILSDPLSVLPNQTGVHISVLTGSTPIAGVWDLAGLNDDIDGASDPDQRIRSWSGGEQWTRTWIWREFARLGRLVHFEEQRGEVWGDRD